MITTSAEYKTKINSSYRQFETKALVYFDGDDQSPVTFTGSDIFSVNLLEESKADTGKIFGAVSANQIDMVFANKADRFSQNNTGSAYYGKIRPDVKIEPYLGLKLSGGTEYIPLGVFWSGDWKTPSASLDASVTCRDRMAKIIAMPLPMLPVVFSTNVQAMFFVLFEALGLLPTEYYVDPALTQAIDRGWYPSKTVGQVLNYLCEAGNCHVYADRYGKIQVRKNVVSGSAVATLDDTYQILTGDNPISYLDTFSSVRVKYKKPFVKAAASMLKVDLTVPTGNSVLSPLTFSGGPLAVMDQANLTCSNDITVQDISFGTWAMSLSLNNAGTEEIVTLEVLGKSLDMAGFEVQAVDATASYSREITIENNLIQSEAVATAYAAEILDFAKRPDNNFTFALNGDPSIELGDILQIDAESINISAKVMPYRISVSFSSDDFTYTMDARRVA